jgi:hypothetical protein
MIDTHVRRCALALAPHALTSFPLLSLRARARCCCWSDEVGALVLDLGTQFSKAGYAGEDTPKAVFHTVRRQRHQGTRSARSTAEVNNSKFLICAFLLLCFVLSSRPSAASTPRMSPWRI